MHIFLSYLALFFLEWEMFRTKLVKKTKTHFMIDNFFFRKSCRLWDNVEKYGTDGQTTDDNVTRRMLFACWIPKATDTHSEYVTVNAFSLQQLLYERDSTLGLHV
jgi:hypothetical protein